MKLFIYLVFFLTFTMIAIMVLILKCLMELLFPTYVSISAKFILYLMSISAPPYSEVPL